MALPPIQQPVYGDRTALSKLGSTRITNNPAADVQTAKDMRGGRPATSFDPAKPINPEKVAAEAMRSAPQQGYQGIPEDHLRQINTVAFLQSIAEKWVQTASQPGAGPLTKAYATAAVRSWRAALEQARMATPFFDGID